MVPKKKLTAAEKQRRYREKRKADPEREAAYKEQHKLRNAKRKKINDLTGREKRSQRKYWRKLDKKRRLKKCANEQLPPTPPVNDASLNNTSSGNKTRGRKVILKNRSKCVRENQKLKSELMEMNKKLKTAKMRTEKYRKRLSRIMKKDNLNVQLTPENELTPFSKAKRCLGSPFKKLSRKDAKKSKVVRTLVFHESLVKSLKSGYKSLKKRQHKRVLSSMLMSKYIRNYRLQGLASRAIGLAGRKRLVQTIHKKESKVKFEIKTFFLCDDVSKTTAGMKETITRKKVKMQKRYLVNSMKKLYQHFLKSRVIDQPAISYKTFTRYRPFYVCKPTEVNRDTCLCKYHANITFKSKKLKQLKLVDSEDPHDLYKKIVCDRANVSCMYGTCKECKFKKVPITDVANENELVTWQQWDDVVVTKEKLVKGVKKQYQVKVAMKVNVTKPVKALIEEFHRELALFKKHVLNIKKQNDAYKSIKETLSDKQAILHVDFSENYSCKLAEEIQSYHFGASREQATLHTGVLIVKDNEKPIPFSTLSDSRDHNPAAIWAHLRPILHYLSQHYTTVETIHFFSDGPSTQYRQKKSFYLFSKLLYDFGFKSGSWNYFEASHGKGAPDGVGGALKRMANAQVAHGVDIPDAKSLFSLLKEDSSIELFFVSQSEIDVIQVTVPETLKPIPGTRLIHQVVTNSYGHIMYRPLSCFCSKNNWLEGVMCNCHIPFKSYSYVEGEDIVPKTTTSASKPKASTSRKKKKSIYKTIYFSDEDSEPEPEPMWSMVSDGEIDVHDIISLSDPNHDADFPIVETPSTTNVRKGVHVLVKLLGGARKKINYQYVAVCQTDIEEDGEVKVMFLNVVGENASLFKTNESDISYIDFSQIVGVLPNPNIKLKGNRVFYKFPASIDVFEKN